MTSPSATCRPQLPSPQLPSHPTPPAHTHSYVQDAMTPTFTAPPPTAQKPTRLNPVCKRSPHVPVPRRQAERVAITRSIVIFADYLSDLAVLDALSDISQSPHPETTTILALLGATAGLLTADLLTGLAALTAANLPDGSFDVFGRPYAPRIILRPKHISVTAQQSVNGPVVTEVKTVVEVVSPPRDLFQRLVNSCFITTPPLTVFTGWATEATGDSAVFMETFFVVLLSISALAPILRAGEKDCEFIARLRKWGLLKTRQVGWCQVVGFWDGVLDWGFRRGITRRRPP